jgi:hypothetical protein
MRFFEAENNLNRRYTLPCYSTTREINTIDDYNKDALYVGHVAQGGWRASILDASRFNEKLEYSEDIDFICRILVDNKFVFSKDIEYLYRIRYAKDSAVNIAPTNLQWYSRVWNVFVPLFEDMIKLRNNVPLFVPMSNR